jgi:hypothetical protein
MHQRKKLLISTLMVGMLVLSGCDKPLSLSSLSGDVLVTVSHSQNGIQVLGLKRIYVVQGDYIVITNKGKITLEPGTCLDLSSGEKSVFPIKEIISFNKELNTEAINNEANIQFSILKKRYKITGEDD